MSSMHELPPVLDASADAVVAGSAAAPEPARPTPHLRLVPDVPLDFDDAVRRITPRLQRYARRRLGDAHEAEELVQEALLRAYKHGDQLLTEDDLIAWCTVVTGRLVIDRLRVRGRSTSVADVPEGTRVGRDTAEVVVARDEARMALDALDAMPPRQAAVLWAREVEGQGYDEIGLRFGMTEPAVRSILTRARKALRKEYAARGGTLPTAGLAALAPWIGGLRWADRLRGAATKLGAPVAIGAMAIGLVGGALTSPLFRPQPQGPAPVQAVVSQSLTTAKTLVAPAAHRVSTAPRAARRTATSPTRVIQLSTAEHLTPRQCVGKAHNTAVGDEACTGGGHAARLYVRQSLPENPTHIRDVGIESNKIDCSGVPDTPVTACTPSNNNGEHK